MTKRLLFIRPQQARLNQQRPLVQGLWQRDSQRTIMQQERLEGWMVQQIEHANLAKETLLQLPTRPVAPASPKFSTDSPGKRARPVPASPRAFVSPPEPSEHRAASFPASTPRQRHLRLFDTRDAAHAESGGVATSEGPIDKQWRSQFSSRSGPFIESGRVDRTKVLRGDGGSSNGEPSTTNETDSPLLLWGLPREQILDFIRQSLLPSSWVECVLACWSSMESHTQLSERQPASPTNRDTDNELKSPGHAKVPPVQLPIVSSKSTPTTARQSISQPKPNSTRVTPRPRTSPLPSTGLSLDTSSRVISPRPETRIVKLLDDLRSNPAMLAAFLKDVERSQQEQRAVRVPSRAQSCTRSTNNSLSPTNIQQRTKASDKLRENKERAGTARSAADREERKKLAAQRVECVRQKRDRIVKSEDDRNSATLAEYQRRVKAKDAVPSPPSEAERAQRVTLRRCRLWLSSIAFSVISSKWHAQLVNTKVLLQIARAQNRAARIIQSLWRKWKWQNASRHTVVIYTWLRRCLWKLLFRVRVARKIRSATLLQRFMIDNFSGSRETRNFNHMMAKWRGKVIHAQRLGLAFVLCSRARLHALSLWWDTVDHERQRYDRQRALAGGNEDDDRSGSKRPSSSASSTSSSAFRRVTFRPSRKEPSLVVEPSTPPGMDGISSPGGSRLGYRRSSRMILQLDAVEDKLSAMQMLMTPVEIQRLQQQAPRVIRVSKSIKMRLLLDYLVSARREYMKKLRAYYEHIACASYAMEVKLDDARAIVQSSVSWRATTGTPAPGIPLAKPSTLAPPVFQLYSRPEAMVALVKRGVQLTLENDPELKAAVERQAQRRTAAVASPFGPPTNRPSMAWPAMKSPLPPSMKKSVVANPPLSGQSIRAQVTSTSSPSSPFI